MSARTDLWQPFLNQFPAVILDGGLATELERRGADLGDPLWSAKALIDTPELIRDVHEDYFRAGADVGASASYQASFEGFARRGIGRIQAAELMRKSVRLVQEARDRFLEDQTTRVDMVAGKGERARVRPLVAASVGCYGASLADGSEYRGKYGLSVRQLMDWHRPRLEVLADSGADVLACETIPCIEEAEALCRLFDEMATPPAWISFSCRDEQHICQGELFAEAVQAAQMSAKVIAVGVNCTAPRLVGPLLSQARPHAQVPLLAYPNSGERWNAQRRHWEKSDRDFSWRGEVRSWPARLVGGCCRTTPATIREIVEAFGG